MNATFTLENRTNIAKSLTGKAASMKDWRIRNKRNRAMREIAREWVAGKGYLIGSVIDLKAKYGDLCHYESSAPGANEKRIWAISLNQLWKKLQFVAI